MASVALAGFASSSRDYVKRVQADEVWSLNMIHSSASMREIFPLNIDRLFDLHPVWMLQADWYATSGDHWGWMTRVKHHYPVYMTEVSPQVHNSVRYPLEEVSEKFLGGLSREGVPIRYFTSSFCYMMALALLEGFEDIYVSGFEMGSDTEYFYQKAGAEFWLGIASQRARVHLPRESQLLSARLYGFDRDGQIITMEQLQEYHGWYMSRHDEVSLSAGDMSAWIETQMLIGAVTALEDAMKSGLTTRQVLEGQKSEWEKTRLKFLGEVNALNAQSWERKRQEQDFEDLARSAFDRLKYLYRYDGAYQVACKLIAECDLQKPTKPLAIRTRFQAFSNVAPPPK